MSVSATPNRVSYAGNGVTTGFGFAYYFVAASDFLVYIFNTTTYTMTLKALTTDYTVSGTADSNGVYPSGGTINMVVAPATGEKLVIVRNVSQLQGLRLQNNNNMVPSLLELQYDELTLMVQRLQDLCSRSFRLSDGYPNAFDTTMPGDLKAYPNSVPLVNATGDGFAAASTWPTTAVIAGAATSATAAAASAAAAAASATAAAASAASAATSDASASQWATKTTGIVAATDYSSKEFAQGTQASTGGSSKNWAQQTGADVTGAAANSRSAKSWAQDPNAGATLGGSAKDWAQTVSGAIDGASGHSAKTWARDPSTLIRGASGGGSAKDWATYLGGTVDSSEYSAKKYAADAAVSASAAAVAVSSAMFRDVVFKTFADSPIALVQADQGKLFAVDTSGGNVVFNLPAIAGLTLTSPFSYGIKKTSADGNTITINRASTDTIDAATSKVISTPNAGATLIPDTDPTPDTWTSVEFGATAGNMTIDVFSGTGAQTAFTLSVSPGSKANTGVFIEGVYQQQSTYSLVGATLTFSTAPPSGTSNIEVKSGTTLSIGVPSDATVTNAKMAAMPATTIKGNNTGGSATPVDMTVPQLAALFTAPTVQRFLSGTGNYTTPSNAKYIKVKLAGGGGGGSGSGAAVATLTGGTGGTTSFGTSLLTALGGVGGINASSGGGGAGGTVTVNGPAIALNAIAGATGGSAHNSNSGLTYQGGGSGSGTPLCGTTPLYSAATANGGGGGAGGSASGVGVYLGSGGGAGGYIEAVIFPTASQVFAFAVGAGGTVGAAGTSGATGYAGGSGIIIVEEYYQ